MKAITKIHNIKNSVSRPKGGLLKENINRGAFRTQSNIYDVAFLWKYFISYKFKCSIV